MSAAQQIVQELLEEPEDFFDVKELTPFELEVSNEYFGSYAVHYRHPDGMVTYAGTIKRTPEGWVPYEVASKTFYPRQGSVLGAHTRHPYITAQHRVASGQENACQRLWQEYQTAR